MHIEPTGVSDTLGQKPQYHLVSGLYESLIIYGVSKIHQVEFVIGTLIFKKYFALRLHKKVFFFSDQKLKKQVKNKVGSQAINIQYQAMTHITLIKLTIQLMLKNS